MTDVEIEAYRQKLNVLTAEHPEDKIYMQLITLAKEVGASTKVLSERRALDANTSELIKNIHQALQTATMVNMCSAATKGYEIATKASKDARKQFWIVAAIAIISAIAAWVAPLLAILRHC